MTPELWSLLSVPAVELLGWVLLHFVWQGALVAGVLAGTLVLLRGHAPSVRYAVSCAALAGLLVLPVGTGLLLSESILGSSSASPAPVAAVGGVGPSAVGPSPSPVEGATSLRTRMASWIRPALPWIVFGWAGGVLLFSARLAGGAWRVRRLRWASTPAPARWQDRLEALADRLGLRSNVALQVSGRVDGPLVAGWWRPVVLVPTGLLTGMPPEQVEALLLHELAHVRRHDVLVGRLQAVVEALLFFHPATWWISRQVRQAREACCDDLAVQAGADRTAYARALTSLAERSLAAPRPAGALAANDGALLARIRRLLSSGEPSSQRAHRLSMAVALFLLAALPLAVAACASQQSTTESGATGDAPPREQANPSQAFPSPSEAETEARAVIVPDDSARRAVPDGNEPVEMDSLDKRALAFRFGGEGVDTLDAPDLGVFFRSDSLEKELRLFLDADSLERSLHGLRLHSDSLARHLRTQFDLDSLKHRALQVQRRADSLREEALRGQFQPDSLAHRFGMLLRDSTFSFGPGGWDPEVLEGGFGVFLRRPDTADVEALMFGGSDLDVDSLQRRADRLQHWMEHLMEQREQRGAERLRERAERLREQAEQLERRAEEMEESREQGDGRSPPRDGESGNGG